MFRAMYRRDLGIRALDAIGHATLALLLPGLWWFQYLPDVMLPLVFGSSLFTNKLLAKRNPLLVVHKALHSNECLFLLLIAGASVRLLYQRWWLVYLALHWMCHLALDSVTHDRWRKYEHDSSAVFGRR